MITKIMRKGKNFTPINIIITVESVREKNLILSLFHGAGSLTKHINDYQTLNVAHDFTHEEVTGIFNSGAWNKLDTM